MNLWSRLLNTASSCLTEATCWSRRTMASSLGSTFSSSAKVSYSPPGADGQSKCARHTALVFHHDFHDMVVSLVDSGQAVCADTTAISLLVLCCLSLPGWSFCLSCSTSARRLEMTFLVLTRHRSRFLTTSSFVLTRFANSSASLSLS